MKRAKFVTFGCKINQYDTQALREALGERGYEEVDGATAADLVVVNACTVTNRAGEKAVAAVRRLARAHPGARLVVTGCLAPEDRAALTEIPAVEHIVANEEKDQIAALVEGAPLTPTDGRRSRNIFALETSRFAGHTRAFLKVHDGCDDFCSYCIIPFLRGKSKSRPLADVRREAERLSEHGHRELVVTGVHLRRYGRDLGIENGLVELLRALRAVPGVDRVRLSSVGEKTFTDEFLEFFQRDPGLCPFFHVPLQSGSDTVLARMRRDSTAQGFVATMERIRSVLPRAVISTDLMIGFPGETESEFEESLATCRDAGFAFMHIFPYSPRSGTRAAQLEGQVPEATKLARVARARDLEQELRETEGRRWIGQEVRVLVESHREGRAQGLSREGLRVQFAAEDGSELRNQEVPVKIVDCGLRLLHGRRRGVLRGAQGVERGADVVR